jgi:hypothetical protein
MVTCYFSENLVEIWLLENQYNIYIVTSLRGKKKEPIGYYI